MKWHQLQNTSSLYSIVNMIILTALERVCKFNVSLSYPLGLFMYFFLLYFQIDNYFCHWTKLIEKFLYVKLNSHYKLHVYHQNNLVWKASLSVRVKPWKKFIKTRKFVNYCILLTPCGAWIVEHMKSFAFCMFQLICSSVFSMFFLLVK